MLEGVNTDQIGHRFIRPTSSGRGKVMFDVLAPSGVGERARLITVPPARTVQAPGSLQAFDRSRLVEVLIRPSWPAAATRDENGGCPAKLGSPWCR